MATKVFYAWQSDHDGKVCHYLIRDATQDAIDRLKADAKVEEADAFSDIVLDSDTAGVPGTPKIAETIKKKIVACDVFLADVTFVANYKSFGGREKRTPNANVLIELGHALAMKTDERILLVMNTAFGSFEDLPFDLRHSRKPILYHLLPDASKAERDAAQKQLGDRLYMALGLMLNDIGQLQYAANAEAETTKLEQSRQASEVERHHFEEQLRTKTWRHFNANRSIMAVSITPLLPQKGIDFARHEVAIRERIAVMGADGWDHRYFAGRLVLFAHRRDNNQNDLYWATTEVSRDGTVRSASVMRLEPVADETAQAGRMMYFHRYERRAIMFVSDCIKTLRSFGVQGPFSVGISLLFVRNVWVHPTFAGDSSYGHELDHEDVITEAVEIPAATLVEDRMALAAILKPAFVHIWQAFGYPTDPCFRGDEFIKKAE